MTFLPVIRGARLGALALLVASATTPAFAATESTFTCKNGTELRVIYRKGKVRIWVGPEQFDLTAQRTAAGLRYISARRGKGGVIYQEKADVARFQIVGHVNTTCRRKGTTGGRTKPAPPREINWTCKSGQEIRAVYVRTGVVLWIGSEQFSLGTVSAASGVKYMSARRGKGGVVFWEKGRKALFEIVGHLKTTCRS